MKKKLGYVKKYMLKAALGVGASILLVSTLSLIHNNKSNGLNHTTSTSTKEVSTNINSTNNTTKTKSATNQRNSLTTTCNYSETNDYSISAFKSQYAYQWSSNASSIGDFIFENINILFTNTRNIVRSDIVIQDELTKINDKKGEVTVSLYLTAWQYEGQLVYTPSQTFTIKFSGFKILSNSYADPSIRNLYQTYFKFKDITHSAFPSSILEKLLALNGKSLDDSALKILNEYLYMGPIPNAINDFVFEISGDANNLTGALNLVIKLNYILTSDDNASYTKILESDFNKNPFIFTISLCNTASKKYFTNVGISSLSQTILNVNSLSSISQKYNVSSFIFDLKNTGLQEVLKSEIAKLVKHNTVRYNSSNISFNLDELSSNVSAGIVTVPVTISNFYTINSSLDKTFNFTFMVEPTSTPVFLKSSSFPMLMDVNEAIEKIKQDIKSKKNFEEQTFIRQFLNVSNINFKNTKVIEIRTTNLNSMDNSVTINFKFSNVTTIDGSGEVTTGDVWTDSFNYKFYKESKETSIINPIKLNSSMKFENNSVSDVYPYVVANQNNYTFIKEIIVNQGTINKPGTILPDQSVSVEYDTSNVFITKATPNNKTGEILVEGYLNKYLVEENNQLVCKENGKLTFTTTITGFKNVQSYTSISRNPTYKNEYANTLPSAFANDVKSGTITNNISLVKKFLLIYYHPYTSLDGSINNDQEFKNTKLEIVKFDDKRGTVDIKFTIDGKFNNDNNFSYSSNTWTSDVISFNFFKAIDEPTQIENEINDTNAIYNKYSAIGALTAINNINNSNWQSTSDDNILYNTIKELLTENLHFTPNNFTINNIKELNVVDYDNDNKWIDIELKLDYYINDQGETIGPLSDLESSSYGTFKTRLNANFRNVERTEFNTGPFLVSNVSKVNASDWLKTSNDPAIDYLYNAYLNNNSPKVLKGDIPGLGNSTEKIQRSDIIIENVVADDNTASVTVEASLKKYWQYNTSTNKNEIVTNSLGYTPKTKITFIGFMSPGTTILPLGTEYEVDSTLSKYYASELDPDDSQAGIDSDEFTLSKLKNFIFGTYDDTGDENTNDSYGESTSGLITGKKLNMSWQDVELYLDKNDTQTVTTSNIFGKIYQLEPNDLEGTLIVRGELKKQWYLNFETGDKVLGQAPEGRREFSFTLKGFQKRQPTSVNTSINSDLTDKYASDVSIAEIQKIVTEKGFSGSLPTSDIAQGKVWELIESSRQNNNREGTITIQLKLNAKYDNSNSLIYSKYIDPSLTANIYTIVIKNFNKSEPTTFIRENVYKIDQYNNILNNSAQTVSSVIKGEIQNNDLIEELKYVIYNDIIASGKMRITNNDIELESISHDNKTGSLTIKIKLKKYWDNNCDWIDTTTTPTAPALEKQITLTTFKITGQTKVNEQTPIDASKSALFNNLTSDVFAKLINEKNQQYLQEAMKMIWDENVVNYQDSYTDGMNYEHIEILNADASGNLLTLGQAKVTFKFNTKGYWNENFDYVKQESKEFTVLFINFKRVVGTTLIPGEKLINDKVYNSVGSRFDEGDKDGNEGALQFKPNNNISKLTPSQWIEECQKASTTNNPDEYLTQLTNFIFYNKEEFIINPPVSDFNQSNIILKKIKVNDKQGTIECSFTVNKYIDGSGDLKEDLMQPEVPVVFKQFMKQEGTKYTDSTTIDITEYEDLFNYVTTKKIEASQITGSYEFNGDKGLLVNEISDTKLTELIRKLLLEKGLTGFVPQFDNNPDRNITWENIYFSQVESNKFNRSITLKFWTNRYYTVGSNDPINEKLDDGWEITLINFYPPSGQETIIKDLSAKISTFNDSSVSGGVNSWFVDPSGLGIYTPDVASDANSNEATRLEARDNLKKWIFDKAVSGNKDGLSWEDVDITSGYDNYNIIDGTLTLTFRLKKYWTTSGPSNNYSPIYTVNLSNFKTQKPTDINDVIFNLTNYSESAPNYDKYVANIIDKIKSNTSTQVLDQYRAELEEYLMDYIAWNGKDIFTNLPPEINNLNNPEFYEKFKNCFNISIIVADEQRSTINVSVQLKYYVDEYGEVQGNVNGTSNTSKNFNITFSGFKTLRPTSIPNQLNIINVAKNGGQIKFNYYEQMLSTTYADGSQYYWYNSTPETIYDDIVSAAPASSNMTISDARSSFTKTIINWINTYAVDNPAFTNKIDTVTIKSINYNNSQGVIYIEYSVNYGYEKDVNGNYVETTLKTPLQGSLRLEGFQTKSILNTSSVKTILALGLSAFGVFLLLIIILIILFKRKRDIEYRQ